MAAKLRAFAVDFREKEGASYGKDAEALREEGWTLWRHGNVGNYCYVWVFREPEPTLLEATLLEAARQMAKTAKQVYDAGPSCNRGILLQMGEALSALEQAIERQKE
ncbi:MAG TPA: hypothetical protein VMW24_25070 [Sedimentisphaerales bacterium]|nr:hypothetical protein [Sedimentisphaerales bacterium]